MHISIAPPSRFTFSHNSLESWMTYLLAHYALKAVHCQTTVFITFCAAGSQRIEVGRRHVDARREVLPGRSA
jgi:hypothetical protein